MNTFSTQECLVAQSVINKGLQNASKALSLLIKEDIRASYIEAEDISIGKSSSLILNTIPNSTLYLLTTEVMGELKGSCCLVFTEQEAAILRETMLPPSIAPSSTIYEEMKDAILLEADNIIAAAVITEFANLLNKKMYGNVPHLSILSNEGFKSFIHKTYSNNKSYVINFKTFFSGAQKSFKPFFLWFLEESFIESIKGL